MNEKRRSNANRANAQRSTGPKTAAGKARVAKNALRHGLAVHVLAVPELEAEVNELARLLAGEAASPSRLSLALAVAEAQIDLKRIRTARVHTLNDPESFKAPVDVGDLIYYLRRAYKNAIDEDDPRIHLFMQYLLDANELWRERGFEENILRGVRKLSLFDRYERRALSRRKHAIRRFYESEAQTEPGVS